MGLLRRNNLNREGAARRITRGFCATIIVVCLLRFLGLGEAHAQGSVDDAQFHFKEAGFRIPFTVPPGQPVSEVQLYLSRDRGFTWKAVQKADPKQGEFTYGSRDGDGSYWFAVQTILTNQTAIPPEIRGAMPGALRVNVDSRPPVVELSMSHTQDGFATINWRVSDDYLKLETMIAEYRIPPGNQWYPIRDFRAGATGSHTFNAGTAAIEARLVVYDKAGNMGQTKRTSGEQGGLGSGSPFPDRRAFQQQPDLDIKYINSNKVRLRYDVDNVGTSGVKKIHAYRRTFPGGWEKAPIKTFEELDKDKNIVLDLPEEGLFGYSLIAESGVQLSLPAPAGSDPPQVKICVDRTPPKVRIDRVQVSRNGTVSVFWEAQDKENLMSRQSITIKVARDANAPPDEWKPIHNGKLDNSGQFVWTILKETEPKLFFRVEAEDWAGNVGFAVTEKEVTIDLSTPRVFFQGLEPVKP